MALDFSILKPLPMPDPFEAQQKAMTLKQLALQNQKLERESGKIDFEQKAKELDFKINQAGAAARLALSAKDQPSYEAALEQAKGLGIDVSGLPQIFPGEDLMKHYAYMAFKAEDAAKAERAPLEKHLLESQIAKNYADAAREREEKDPSRMAPAKRLFKAGGEVKQKIGHLTSGLQALTNYEDAFRKGGRQSYVNQSTPLIGEFVSSTPIDEARTSMEEAIGRLASGGAINKDEEARFRRMLPKAADSDQDAARKLVNLRNEMEAKLTAYGFQPGELGELGYDPAKLGYGSEYAAMENRGLIPKGGDAGGLVKTAHADGKSPPKAPKFSAGSIVAVGGRHYRVAEDGDTLIPIQGKKK